MLGSQAALVNGVATRCIDFADRGFQYGDGVFTTLFVSAGIPQFLEDHLDRLQRDAARLALPSAERAILIREVGLLSQANQEMALKIMLTRGIGGRGYRCPDQPDPTRVLICHPTPDYPSELRTAGIRARLCRMRLGINPLLAGIKHLNRLEQVLARSEWSGDEIREGLLLDHEGYVVEGVMSNLFLVKNGKLCTPAIDRCGVAGIMRARVIAIVEELGLEIQERRITLPELHDADELFLTNCVIQIWPIRELENKCYGVGAVTRKIQARVTEIIAAEQAKACRA